MAKHSNNGNCQKCFEIFERYPGFNKQLKEWFFKLQKVHPIIHISCAGRGETDQEAFYRRRVSKARWMQSAHNYGAAIDLFEMGGDLQGEIYEASVFNKILPQFLQPWLEWYGVVGHPFFELPHVEIRGWKKMVQLGKLTLCKDETKYA